MSCLKAGFSVYGSNDFAFKNRAKGPFRVCSSFQTLEFKDSSNPRECLGKTLDLLDQKPARNFITKSPKLDALNVSSCFLFVTRVCIQFLSNLFICYLLNCIDDLGTDTNLYGPNIEMVGKVPSS